MAMFKRRLWLATLLVFTGLAIHAETFVFYLKNGDRITGVLLSEEKGQLKIRTPWQPELGLPLSEVAKRVKVEEPAVAAGTNAAPAWAAKGTGTNAVTAAPGGKLPPVAGKWKFDAEAGLDISRNTVVRELYHGRLKVQYAKDRFRDETDYRVAYGRTDGQLSDNRMDGSIKTDFDLGKERRFFAYNLMGAGYDTIRLIDLQYEIGPGMGYRWITRSNYVLNSELGVSYQREEFSDATGRTDVRLRFAEDMSWKVNKRVTFDEKLEFMPDVNNLAVYRVRFESSLRYWLLTNLSLNLTGLDIYDTNPAAGVSRNDLQVRSSIGVKF